MKLRPLSLDGAYLLIPEPREDARGSFARCYDAAMLRDAGLTTEFPEWSLSGNRRAGTLRGLHWQAAPHGEVKLVQCVRGAIFDVIVDMRRQSNSYGQWFGVALTQENRHLLYVPDGFAHGFQTLADDSEVYYHISEPYRPGGERGVRWDDPQIGIDWPETTRRIVSERDGKLPLLAALAEDD